MRLYTFEGNGKDAAPEDVRIVGVNGYDDATLRIDVAPKDSLGTRPFRKLVLTPEEGMELLARMAQALMTITRRSNYQRAAQTIDESSRKIPTAPNDVPLAPKFRAEAYEVKRSNATEATAKSKQMAQRIANALNGYEPNSRGI